MENLGNGMARHGSRCIVNRVRAGQVCCESSGAVLAAQRCAIRSPKDALTWTAAISQVILCIVLSSVWGTSHAAGWTAELTVTQAFTEGTTDTIGVYTQGGTTYASGCAVNAWAVIANTEARRARAYATSMTALASGKKIRFFYADACGELGFHAAIAVMLSE